MYKFKERCKYYYSEELRQKQAVTQKLVNKILFSKRLLVDHVESLEECMEDIGTFSLPPSNAIETQGSVTGSKIEVFTLRNASVLVGATAIEQYFLPKSWRFLMIPSVLLSGGFGAAFLIKSMFICRNKIVESQLTQLIKSIDEFGNCIRKNMTYFNEKLIMKTHELIENREIERAWDCITAIKTVTEMLNEATRNLEANYPIPDSFTKYYSPMEDLKECDYFKNNVTDYTPKNIKDFHNIFAYVQSQYLLRLALTVYTKPSLSRLNADLTKIDCLIRQMVQEEVNHFTNLAIERKKKKQMELDSLNERRTMKNRVGPVALLQDSSLKLSARMVAVAAECQALDITLQKLNEEIISKNNAKHLVDVANNFRLIESALSICFDDFQRLMLVYNKFLDSKIENEDKKKATIEQENSSGDSSESFLRVEISNSSLEPIQKDDFFAYMFDASTSKDGGENEKSNKDDAALEILNFEKKITEGKFRPVLKQLKDRIGPIREVMLQKEKEVLAAKGIDVDELFKHIEPKDVSKTELDIDNKNIEEATNKVIKRKDKKKVSFDDGCESDSSESSTDMDYKKRTKKLKERDNFAEMRNFLAQKHAVNILTLENPNPPVTATGEEEILESEC